jgi:hypothetical protein
MYKWKTTPLYLENFQSIISLMNSILAVTREWIENMETSKHLAQKLHFCKNHFDSTFF